MIGQDHIRRLTQVISGAAVVAVTDVNAEQAAAGRRRGARGEGVRHRPGTDRRRQRRRGRSCAPGVPPTRSTCWPRSPRQAGVLREAAGHHAGGLPADHRRPRSRSVVGLVQVGYMRRYDPAYRAMKEVSTAATSAPRLMMHSGHRNPRCPAHYTREMAITDTAVHDIDTARWLLGEEIVAAQVLKPRKNSLGGDLEDPLLTVLETETGVLIDIETNVNIRYGYDIRGEIVGEQGTVSLAESTPIIVRQRRVVHRPGHPGLAGAVHPRLRRRIPGMDRRHRRQWRVRSQLLGRVRGRGVSDAAVEALHDASQQRRPIDAGRQAARPDSRQQAEHPPRHRIIPTSRNRQVRRGQSKKESTVATIRLTVAQAVVRFLAKQYSERDGVQQRLIPGCFGIFGHGNVAGVGQALLEAATTGEADLPYYLARNEQGMVHAAAGLPRPATGCRRWPAPRRSVPGSANMLTGAALATTNRLPVLLLASDIFATRVGSPVLQELELPSGYDISVNDAFRPLSRFFDRVWRPEQLPAGDARRDAGAHRPGRDRRRHPRPAAGRAGRGATTGRRSCSPKRVWHIPRPVPEPAALARAVAAIRSREAAADRRRRRGHLQRGDRGSWRDFAAATGIPVADTQAGKGGIRWDHPQAVGGVGSTGSPVANALARDADVIIGIGTRYQRLHHRIARPRSSTRTSGS